VIRVSTYVQCRDFPCGDVNTARYSVPQIDIDPDQVRILMISEAPPPEVSDDFYAAGDPFYWQTTVQALGQAGVALGSVQDLLDLGVYITTAVKCGKIGYGVKAPTIVNCSQLLETEMGLFPNLIAVLLMGDVAIKAMNYIAKRQSGKRLIPSGSTYKIRRNEYSYRGMRVFPSYLQTGKSFLIEKSKQKMIAEDIRAALDLVK
jgi:uracil-DNA glycosylase